jgi:hypothetical protein
MTIATGQQALAADILASDRHFTELAGNDNHEASVAATWEDWDLSTIVPAKTKYVLVQLRNGYTSAKIGGARKNGSTDDRKFSVPASGNVCLLTEVDANRVIEVYAETVTDGPDFGILGYWAEA